jgi:hypothetical protein
MTVSNPVDTSTADLIVLTEEELGAVAGGQVPGPLPSGYPDNPGEGQTDRRHPN